MMKATTYPGHQMKTRLHETVGLLKISVYSMQKHTSISKVLWIPLINCQIWLGLGFHCKYIVSLNNT